MTEREFDRYLRRVNEQSEPFVPLVNCFACGRPIEDDVVILTRFEPPRWYHVPCDPFPETEPGWEAKRKP